MNHNPLPSLVLVFGAVLAMSAVAHASNLTDPGKHWTASVQAETDKKYAEAINELRAYDQQGGDPFLTAERTGWLNYLAADYVKSEAGYARAKLLQPTAITPMLGLLADAEAQKDVKKIERAAEDILRVEPTNYRAQTSLAALHFANRDYRRAISDFRRVLMTYPDDADTMSGAGWSAFYLGLRREASDYFRRLVSMSPSYPYAQRGFDLASGKTPSASTEASK